MDGKKLFRILCIINFLFISCHIPSDEENSAIQELNNKFPKYEFESGRNHGLNLKIKVKNDVIDTFELKTIFSQSILKYRNKSDINWVYLDVYIKNKYFITISKTDTFNFFKSGEIDAHW
jgi:hypothetical protein